MSNIKTMLENDNYIIILDTNVLLNIYRYSPEFSEFALECLNKVNNFIYLPATVRMEYEKHYRGEFSKRAKRITEASKGTEIQIQNAKDKILKSCNILEQLHFPDIQELRDELSQKMDDAYKAFCDFFEDRPSLNIIQNFWEGIDYLAQLVQKIDTLNHILESPSQKDIYTWCDEGEKRYKEKTPPGFKDAKNKDGVRKYSDLIIWKEILRFAKLNHKNIIFVTDDVKPDWWEESDGNFTFHSKLLAEFYQTQQLIAPMTSNLFYLDVSSAFDINQTDSIEMALKMTDEDYYDKIAEDVFDSICSTLLYGATEYINDDANIGSEGIDEFEICEYSLINAERVDRYDNTVLYEFVFKVKLAGTSYEYWGRDDDTKEVITSLGVDHIFEGNIKVAVEREADIFIDFEDDNSFANAEIIDGNLEETEHNERIEEPGEFGYCPDCGTPLDIENDGGNGFCVNCAWNH